MKLVVEVGFLEFLGGKEEEEGGVEVLLLLEMEEEMEGRMVEELVAEMVVEMEGGVAGQGSKATAFAAVGFRWLLVEKKEERKNERERKKWGWLYKGGK